MKRFKFTEPINIDNEQYAEGIVTQYADGANAIVLNKSNADWDPDSLIVSVNLGIPADNVIVLDANHYSDTDLNNISNALLNAGVLDSFVRNIQSGFVNNYRLYTLADKFQHAGTLE